jgi:hypothetical protein
MEVPSLVYREDEEVVEVIHRHLKNRVPDLLGEKKSVTFRMDIYDHIRLEWLTEQLGVSKSVLCRDLLASGMASAIQALMPDEDARKALYEQFREESRELMLSGVSGDEE